MARPLRSFEFETDRRRHSRTALADRARDVIAVVAIAALLLAVAVAVFTLGGGMPSGEVLAAVLATIGATLALLRNALPGAPPASSRWAGLPAALLVAVVAFQIVPQPNPVVRVISPGTSDVRLTSLSDLVTQERVSLDDAAGNTISLAPLATQRQLRVLLTAVLVFLGTHELSRSSRRAVALLSGLGIISGLAALFVVLQAVTNVDSVPTLFGFEEPAHRQSGPFLNHSHYGQFANAGAGAALAAAAMLLARHMRRSSRESNRLKGRRGRSNRQKNDNDSVKTAQQLLTDPELHLCRVLAVLAVLVAITVPVSLTRGGTLGLVIGSLAATAAFVAVDRFIRRDRARSGGIGEIATTGMAILGVVVVLGLLVVGGEVVLARLETLDTSEGIEQAVGVRTQYWRDSWIGFTQLPVLGVGLGGFGDVYPYFRGDDVPGGRATHAENASIQFLFETGIVGVLLVLSFAGVVGARLGRMLLKPGPTSNLVAPGLLFGLVAVLVGSLTDFGMYTTSVLAAVGLLCGVATGLPVTERRRRERSRASAVVACGLAVLALCGGIWAAADANRDAAAERVIAEAGRSLGRDWPATDENVLLAGQAYAEALALRPTDPRLRYEANAIRWRSIQQQLVEAAEDPEAVQVLREYGGLVAADLHAARLDHPTIGLLAATAGLIELQVGSPTGAASIEIGADLAPQHPAVLMASARLAASRGEPQVAAQRATQAARQGYSRATVVRFLADLGEMDAALAFAAGDLNALGQLQRWASERNETALAAELASQVEIELRRRAPRDGGAAAELARRAERAGDAEEAEDWYRKAVRLRPGQTTWRLALVRLLRERGALDEALSEAQLAVRDKPGDEKAMEALNGLKMRIRRRELEAREQAIRDARGLNALDETTTQPASAAE
jgi:O-antigen ligase